MNDSTAIKIRHDSLEVLQGDYTILRQMAAKPCLWEKLGEQYIKYILHPDFKLVYHVLDY